MTVESLSPADLETALRQLGAERYHSLHPFHRMMYQGKLNRGQLQALVEPLLLPVSYSHEGRDLDRAVADAGVAPSVAAATA